MTLDQLQLQMTRATFDTWLKDTYVSETQNGTWKIAVKNSFAKDWLENRLLKTVIRTLKNCAGQDDITLEFFVSENGHQPPDLPLAEFDPTDYLLADLVCPDYSQFVPHVKDINRKTGYIALNKYYLTYCEPYLTRRWKIAGRRAWVLWEKLIALDTRKVTDEEFTNWSPIIEINYEQLGKKLNVDHTVIRGRDRHCQRYEEDRKAGQSRGQNCCGRHQEQGCQIRQSRNGLLHCYYWYTGVLEVLGREGWITVESVGKNRYHTLKLQVWHSLPVLTPFQAGFLPEELQQEHQSWLLAAAPRLKFSVEDWKNVPDTVESFLNPRALDYEVSRIFFDRHRLNPYKQTSSNRVM